ncbi:MAG TPA: desulfoferrodoxin [Mollicutes bacterium]|nr:desulfoferrodoxin [Mollicutes bacterium]
MHFFKCNICGNIVELVKNGGGELVCCGEPMEKMLPNTTDEGNEKHLPEIKVVDNEVFVEVGSILHPMEEKHYIEWIVLLYNNKVKKIKLKPGDEPKAIFKIDEDFKTLEVYEYCNIHGLWKNVYVKS